MKAWAWIVKAAQDVYSFAYTEIGIALSLLKVPDKSKYSIKRVAVAVLLLDTILSGIPQGTIPLIWDVAKILTAAGLMILAEVTKT